MSGDNPRENLKARVCPEVEATRRPTNPPGLSTIAYRVGTHGTVLRRLLDRLPRQTLPDGPFAGQRPLECLSDRSSEEPTMALLDAWAVVADVLTFYQERIANESYLRTATERRSVLELARQVGYELGPGVAASAFLAFTVEDAEDAAAEANVPRGTPVQSIPGQDELPQTFETSRDLLARAAWNELGPLLSKPQELRGAGEIFLEGIDTLLSQGDLLLLVARQNRVAVEVLPLRAKEVALDTDRNLTRVDLESPLVFRSSAWTNLSTPELFERVEIHALRTRANIFGHNATRYGSLPTSEVVKDDPFSEADPESDWDQGRTVWTDSRGQALAGAESPGASALYLDRKIDEVVAESWAVLVGRTLKGTREARVYRVLETELATVADYALSSDATGLSLGEADGSPLPSSLTQRPAFDFRRTVVHLQSEPLALAQLPLEAAYPDPQVDDGNNVLTLSSRITDLPPGRPVAITGEAPDGTESSRVVLLQRLDNDPEDLSAPTRLIFRQALEPGSFRRASVRANANVVLATHGETVAEVLGSGDGERGGQRFRLQNPPLTYLSAPLPGGARSTLEVRVDGVRWLEVDTLFPQEPRDRAYQVRVDPLGRACVEFGDGRRGARLPSGQENVTSVYRSGIGAAGRLKSGQLSLMTNRPLGIRDVRNPTATTGADDPEDIERGRANAPVTVRTLGQVVSLGDFEDFARTFAGIRKAQAVPLRGIHLTVAGAGGAAIPLGSDLYDHLVQALESLRLPGPPLTVASYTRLDWNLSGKLVVDERFRREDVFERAEEALLTTFAFERRDLGQPIYATDIIALLQSLEGVVAVDLDALYIEGRPPDLHGILRAEGARVVAGETRAGELLVPRADGISLGARTP